jgi:hypothetical protein
MAAKTRARARSAGIGDPRSRLTVAFDSGRDAGVFGDDAGAPNFGAFASSPGKLSVEKKKKKRRRRRVGRRAPRFARAVGAERV